MTDPRAPGAVAPTVRDLLAGSPLGLIEPPGAPQDLDREISWVHTTEIPDPARYLQGGELVCTVGLSLHTRQDCDVFADALARSRAAGVCFGTGDGHDVVPAELLARCRAHGLPVLIAPRDVPFESISRFVADYRLGTELVTARATAALVPEMMAALRRRDPVRLLLDRAGELLGCYFILDEAQCRPPIDDDHTEATVTIPGLGALVWIGRGTPPDPSLLETIGRFVAAAQNERDIEAALARERVGQLLSLVERRMLLPDALSQLLRWPHAPSATVRVSAWPGGAGALLSLAFPDALVGDASDVCLVLHDAGRADTTADTLSLPSGHSADVPITELGPAITQSRIALSLAHQHGGSIGPDQLSTLTSLIEQLPVAQLTPFVTQLIEPLDRLDRERGTQHVRTLRTFLAANGSPSDTARELFLHTNTVRHRLTRIREITGRDPLHFDDQTAFAIGLRAFDRATGGVIRAPG
ncbi:PucR family transcriptional regulator [Mycobacterium sp. PSTR-4-N]|uniref:PucR family transcriptional regulator n=1 Tax=Mycobacterium sp. PSTR-4-N TaxID=2917745 RepID=UPI001F155C71|nr:PucR family transcriptional regulator [Mycobacterium sp. PSTR-4-N]MCG7596957.1 PucR family transcriptional regulator [Mycobacterium sp. PSTR-4-N]